ncbi:MAG: hypothetical protein ACLFWR_13815 [Acidimicrobiales bacterium]
MADDYASSADLKVWLGISDSVDDQAMNDAITAASRLVDEWCGRHFYKDGSDEEPATRYYVAADVDLLLTDDLVSVDAVTVDSTGDDTPDRELSASQWRLEPVDAAGRGWPYTSIVTPKGETARFTVGARVQVDGVFGWPDVPSPVKQATLHQAAMLFKSSKEGTLGVVAIAGFDGAGLRMTGRLHPQTELLLRPYLRVQLADR